MTRRSFISYASALLLLAATACVPWSPDEAVDEELADVSRLYGGKVFFVGKSFEGRPLTTILYGDEAGAATVVFLYGDCERPGWPEGFDPGGCPLPLDIQNFVCSDGRTQVAVFANSKGMERRASDALRPLGGQAAHQPDVSLGGSEGCSP